MLTLYYARHGETDWNKANRIQGHVEVPLNETGLKQAYELQQKMKDIPLDLVFSSPIGRALTTAQIVLEGRENIPLIQDERIIEQSYGDYEGILRTNPDYQAQRRRFMTRYPNGESYGDVISRIYPFLDELKEKYDGKTILIVAHGGMARVIHSYFYDLTDEEFINYHIANCEAVKYVY